MLHANTIAVEFAALTNAWLAVVEVAETENMFTNATPPTEVNVVTLAVEFTAAIYPH